jgi:hypothetical protein
MHYVRLLILYLSLAGTLFLFIGLYQPWAVLWWEDIQNRRKVIRVYGTLTVILYIAYYVLQFFV